MGHFSKAAMVGPSLFMAGIALMAGLHSNGAGAEPPPGSTTEKANTVSDAAAGIPNTKVATVFGRDIFRNDLEPPAKWLEDREKHLKLYGETPGLVPLDTYRSNKLYETIWKLLSKKYIPKQDVKPTEEELQEYIAHHRQVKARMKQERQERLKQLRTEADKLEKQLPTQGGEDQEETSQQLQKISREIVAIEKTFEIERGIQGRGKKFEQFFAKWWVGNWKKQRWFYKRYGGRVIYQQVGPQAIDAMRDFLKEAEAKKDLIIYDQELKTKFWAPYTKERPGVIVPNPDEVFEHPWSIMDSSRTKNKRQIAPAVKGRPHSEAIETVARTDAFPMELSLEDNAKSEVVITLGRDKTLLKTLPGTMQIDLTIAGDGKHYLYFRCPGYASQLAYVEIADGKTTRKKIKVELFRKRYVILRCAFNTRGERNLEGDGVEEHHIAVSHWGAPKHFHQDWQIWQRATGGFDKPFGDKPYLEFHRFATGFGFTKPIEGVSYEEMKEAPDGEYRCKNRIARKGLVLYCRVNGNRAEGLGYGKLLVEDVTETPPKDVRVIEGRY